MAADLREAPMADGHTLVIKPPTPRQAVLTSSCTNCGGASATISRHSS
jgi:hypothetical protein